MAGIQCAPPAPGATVTLGTCLALATRGRLGSFEAGCETEMQTTKTDETMAKGAPEFLTLDQRVPSAVRDLLNEAEGCSQGGFLTGGTACAQRVIQMLVPAEKDSSDMPARIRAFTEKHASIPPILTSIIQQFGDATSRDGAKLSGSGLNLLVVTLKAILYEIYVLGPERNERLDYVRKAFESIERKGADKRANGAASPEPAPAAAVPA
jgi:hypothetical protein